MNSSHSSDDEGRYIIIGSRFIEMVSSREQAARVIESMVEHAILIDTHAHPDQLLALFGAILISVEGDPFWQREARGGQPTSD
jgi:hypothetical protein